MAEIIYDLPLNAQGLFLVKFYLDQAAQQHDLAAAELDSMTAQGVPDTAPAATLHHTFADMCRGIVASTRVVKPHEAITCVKHGHWEIVCNEDTAYIKMYRCSCCKDEFMLDEGEIEENGEYNYCPNCGAKMD